jgi:hypothetical protein
MDEKFAANAVHNLSAADRRELLRELVETEQHAAVKPGTSWKWDLLLILIIGACILLAAWIGYLVVSLPAFYRTGSWRGAWVGFDIAELVAFAATGWAAWRRRQVLIVCLIVLATLLLCDAWFDVVLDAQTAGFLGSLLSALLVEVPIALIAVIVARRLLRMTIGEVIKYEGGHGPVPPLWKIPLFGTDNGDTPLDRLIKAAKSDREPVNESSRTPQNEAIWPETEPESEPERER